MYYYTKKERDRWIRLDQLQPVSLPLPQKKKNQPVDLLQIVDM